MLAQQLRNIGPAAGVSTSRAGNVITQQGSSVGSSQPISTDLFGHFFDVVSAQASQRL
jgi:hypothetical protein